MKSSVSFNSTLSKFGMGLFETIKVTDCPLDLDLHLDRLFNSARELNFDIDENKEFYRKTILEYIDKNDVKNKALRLTVFDEGYNISLRDITYNEETYKKGFKLCISPIKRGDSIIYRHKTTNYYESMYSKHFATDNGFDDAIFLDTSGRVLECSMSNIFFVKSDTVYTPKSSSPILNGIMKLNIGRVCESLNINLVECDIDISSVDEYEGVFVTNSLMGVMPVTQINQIDFDKENKVIKLIKENL
ncbi:MAG: aminotransferase class IV [Intestinibacter sp.]|uniref:aminotransferase class IV n=1 Tax=Intestinibacter sp. TaxID=1965304 RepID=UPI002A80C771|nr:aminotransferase class IV [Intestinibacter sp.]MDY4574523.1 aminotransferase class IV [Intestinibacter sp.]